MSTAGHAGVAHDCVGALLMRGDDVLLGRRADDRAWLPGAWDVFGGHVRPGEAPEAALRRELEEELGIGAFDPQPLAELHAADWRLRVFAVTQWSGEPVNRQPREHAEIRWMSRAEARRHLVCAHPGFADLIA